MCNFEHFEHCVMVRFKLDTMLCPGVVWDGASMYFSKHEAILSCLIFRTNVVNKPWPVTTPRPHPGGKKYIYI